MSASNVLATVRDARPLVADLARALALAAHVDVVVTRRLRMELFTSGDVSTEADLWSSPLVQSRGSGSLVLRSDVRTLLWGELAADRDELERVWRTLQAARLEATHLLRLEERLTYFGVVGDVASIETELGAVVRAMLDEPSRRRDLAAWSARALARLPEPVCNSDSARVLASVARGWVATPARVVEMVPTPEGARLAARMQPQTKRRPLRLRRVGDTIEVGGQPAEPFVEIDVPADATTIIVDEDRVIPIDGDRVRRVEVRRPDVMIGATDGRRWLLVNDGKVPNLDALAGVAGSRGLGVAYLVAPTIAVASAEHLGAGWEGTLKFGGETIAGSMVAFDEYADIAMLRLETPASTSPLPLASDARAGEVWQAYALASEDDKEEERLLLRSRWTGAIVSASANLVLQTPQHVSERLTRPGMPCFRNDGVIGHMRGRARKGGTIHLAPAHLIAWWLAKVEDQDTDPSRPVVLLQADPAPMLATGIVIGSNLVLMLADGFERFGQPVTYGLDVTIRAAVDAHRLRGRCVERIGDFAVFELSEPWTGPTMELFPALESSGASAEWTTAILVDPGGTLRCDVAMMEREPEVILRSERKPSTPGAAVVVGGRLLGFLQGGRYDEDPSAPTSRHLRAVRVSESVAQYVARFHGVADPVDDASTTRSHVHVSLHTEDPVSSAGLLGVELTAIPGGHRLERHRWGAYQLDVNAPRPLPPQSGFWVLIDTIDGDMDVPEITVTIPHGEAAFWHAVRLLNPRFAEVPVERGEANPILIVARRMPDMPPSQAFRNGIRFVTSVLGRLDADDERRTPELAQFIIPGSGKRDIGEVQQRLLKLRGDADVVLASIDPETDLVEVEFSQRRYGELSSTAVDALLLALGGLTIQREVERVPFEDPIQYQFGSSPIRAGRELEVACTPDAVDLRVLATEQQRSLRGYVRFYVPSDTGATTTIRARAVDGVAWCSIPSRFDAFKVGAIVEDEGVILEAYAKGTKQRPIKQGRARKR